MLRSLHGVRPALTSRGRRNPGQEGPRYARSASLILGTGSASLDSQGMLQSSGLILAFATDSLFGFVKLYWVSICFPSIKES